LQASIAQLDNLDETIGQAISAVNNQTAGIGSAIKDIPILGKGTRSKDLDGMLTTIKADSTLSKLAEMKANSPNGASGLGSLTENEGKLLAAQTAALEQDQSPTQLKYNLEKYRRVRKETIQSMKDFYKQQYGEDIPSKQTSEPITGMDAIDAEMKRRGLLK